MENLTNLRKKMRDNGIDAVIVPQTDPHHGEYLADHWQLRRFLSGFTGSAGQLVVTLDKALLWTDSRYFLQAAQQLQGTSIELMKEGLLETPSIEKWLTENLKAGQVVGFNGMMFSIDETRNLEKVLEGAGLKVDPDFDPAEADVWPDRPELPLDPVYIHKIEYAGEPAAEKIASVLANAKAQGADMAFISALDEIAWTLNIRSNDVCDNPVATAHLLLGPDKSVLFINNKKINEEVKAYLAGIKVTVMPYEDVLDYIKELPADARVLLSATQSAGRVLRVLGDRAVVGTSAVAMLKAVKNDIQIQGVHKAMLRDGVAMVRSLREIRRRVAEGIPTTEMDVADILTHFRSMGEGYKGESFATIAGYAGHGAIVHYSATPESNATLKPESLLLIDSGAQYLDGTTDITRTIALGTPTEEQRHNFTLVMQGHIDLAMSVWPDGTTGHQLDAIARMPLWKEGLSFLHGTGHGVGHFLGVHEGPQSIRLNDTHAPLIPGMITSNEPGVYLSDRYGIRCENLTLVVPAFETEFGRFFKFETLTLCPFDRSLFEVSIMTPEQIAWLNAYHKKTREALMPLLTDEADRRFLEQATEAL